MRVKICGITRLSDALCAAEAGADALGFVFYEKSPRYIRPEEASKLTKRLPPFVNLVGVFVNLPYDNVIKICRRCRLDTAQLHAEEPPEVCRAIQNSGLKVIKAIRVKEKKDLSLIDKYNGFIDALLLDTFVKGEYGGTGKTFTWEWAKVEKVKVILSGGLTPENVAEAIKIARPYAVDVSSGVEISPGVKDHEKIKEFIKNAKTWRKN